jgi:hypothetical protein
MTVSHFLLRLAWTVILLISASLVAVITDVGHCACLKIFSFKEKGKKMSTFQVERLNHLVKRKLDFSYKISEQCSCIFKGLKEA